MFSSTRGRSTANTGKQICQYYQRGNCKYGNKCWNEHSGSTAYGMSNVFGSSSASFSNFGGTNTGQEDKQFEEFVKQVNHEMTVWEKNGLWFLSCLAPLKDSPLLSGFTDTSPEELRVEAYECLKTNNFATYQTNVNQKFEHHKMLRQALKTQTPDAIEALRPVFYKNKPGMTNAGVSNSTTSNVFGKPAGMFSGSAPSTQSSLFGGTSTSTQSSAFGSTANIGANNIFASKQQTSVFGAAPVFGSDATKSFGAGGAFKSTFGSQASGSTLFGGAKANEGTTNLFGSVSQNQSAQGTLFGGSQPTANSGTGSVFGSQVTSQPTANSSSIFGSQGITNPTANSSSLFGSQGAAQPTAISSNIFGSQGTVQSTTNSSSIFGTQGTTQPTANVGSMFGSQGQTTLFGSNQSTSSTLFGGSSQQGVGTSGGTFQVSSAFNKPSQTTSNVFGAPSQAGGSSSIFGSPQQTQGSSQPLFGSGIGAQSTSLFAGNQTQNQGTFGNSFSANNQQNSLFGGNASSEQLGQNVFASSAFAPQTNSSPISMTEDNSIVTSNTQNNSGSLFSGGQMQGPFGLGNIQSQNVPTSVPQSIPQGDTNPSEQGSTGMLAVPQLQSQPSAPAVSTFIGQIYTPLNLLSLLDREEFERNVFHRIPLVPPPKELCA